MQSDPFKFLFLDLNSVSLYVLPVSGSEVRTGPEEEKQAVCVAFRFHFAFYLAGHHHLSCGWFEAEGANAARGQDVNGQTRGGEGSSRKQLCGSIPVERCNNCVS